MANILVVEDDEQINEAICRCLVEAGYGIRLLERKERFGANGQG